jgi:hypothetical protein
MGTYHSVIAKLSTKKQAIALCLLISFTQFFSFPMAVVQRIAGAFIQIMQSVPPHSRNTKLIKTWIKICRILKGSDFEFTGSFHKTKENNNC